MDRRALSTLLSASVHSIVQPSIGNSIGSYPYFVAVRQQRASRARNYRSRPKNTARADADHGKI